MTSKITPYWLCSSDLSVRSAANNKYCALFVINFLYLMGLLVVSQVGDLVTKEVLRSQWGSVLSFY